MSNDLREQLLEIGRKAKEASRVMAKLSSTRKNAILHAMADGIEEQEEMILAANNEDVAHAEAASLPQASIDRLRLTHKRIGEMARGIREVAVLHDPVGEVMEDWLRPNGIRIEKVRVPIGVIGIVYESRPNVTSDAAVLCFKTGNSVILRGGSEAIRSNKAIAAAMIAAGRRPGLPENAIQLVSTTDREAVGLLAGMDAFIDLIIPRGGHGLIETVVSKARVPVIKHYHGVCAIYVDAAADLRMAERIVINAKCQRPGVCNAMETLLVQKDVAEPFLQSAGEALVAAGVEIRADERAHSILQGCVRKGLKTVAEDDWTTEYLDLILAVKIVDSLDAAIEHINHYGSHHSDAIVTTNEASAERFLNEVDSATVYWNASTRFTDGGEFGFGAEIGISTDKLHARGPMGLPELTTYKYRIIGTGQIKE